jgi:hypothetical protein
LAFTGCAPVVAVPEGAERALSAARRSSRR